MPQETTKHTAVLNALKSIEALADLTAAHEGHYDYEVDLEVIVYGRNYNGKNVGPYVRLLTYSPGEEIVHEGDWGNTFYFIIAGRVEIYVQGVGGESKVNELPVGAQFGELSVLAGLPRTATVRAPQSEPVQVLEVRRPALRLLRKLPKFSEAIDRSYRRNSRAATLQDLGAVTQLSKGVIKQLETVSQFRVYSKRHVLFRAGDAIKRIYVLKSGWVRLSSATQLLNAGVEDFCNWDKTTDEEYIGPSHCFGIEAITRDRQWTRTAVLLGRTEVLEISISKLSQQHPELRETLRLVLEPLAVRLAEAKPRLPLPIATAQRQLIDTGVVDGTNVLVMDMDLCVRCGNCSMACHQVHGQSRLLRRGIHITRPVALQKGASFQSLLHPSVCMHCQDPECLTGCPTGAIGRFAGGQIDIDSHTCIGCGDCATQCPYDAISMTPRQPKPEAVNGNGGSGLRRRLLKLFRLTPEPLPAPVEAANDLLAVKCNLCAGTELNPSGAKTPAYSCEENCPTGALLRVDPHTYFAEIKQIEGIVFRDATHAIARQVSHKDRGKRLLHAIGMTATLAFTLLAVLGIMRYKLELPMLGGWLNMRWLTGLVGLAGIACVMAYPLRRQIYRRRVGALRYWMLAHSYLGVIAGIVLLLHGGTHSGGVLTTALMISFDLVILTGIFGVLCYFFAPRLLTKIEGQPLLLDDLVARRLELNEEIRAALATTSNQAREMSKRRVLPHFLSFAYLLRQYLKRESFAVMTASARREFQQVAAELPTTEQDSFLQVVELAAISRRVDALIYLHQMLKLWVAPHVLVTSLMLVLMLVHIIQVIYYVV